jgi:hypothetical protein
MKSKKDLIREAAEADLVTFIRLIHPNRVLGSVHEELIRWWNREGAKSHQLVLLPRDHQKSAMIAYRVAWEITRNPAIRILYISSTANLADKQLKFIKDILLSDKYRFYWPDMVNADEAKREKWTNSEISVDHPKRKQEIVRDPTVFIAGLTTNIVGLHCDIAVLDDVVVDDTAYTPEGREKVKTQASFLASIGATDSRQWAVGTRYHPQDLYNDFANTTMDVFNDEGDIIDSTNVWEVFERQVESNGDGTGEFLWPSSQRYDGKWFGFSREILAKKKATYYDKTKFNAQYYNNPNDTSTANIDKALFQYYDRKNLVREEGKWFLKGVRLNVFAAVDFAYSVKKEADSTAIVVVGIDGKHNIYILEIERFKSTKISDYFDKILRLHTKWDFRKIRAETTAAQMVIVEDLKQNYFRPHGLALSIDDHRPTKKKEERIDAILQPRYSNRQIWHYAGGNCEILEEELVLQNPAHDDIKDALASAVEVAVPPSFMGMGGSVSKSRDVTWHPRFGGMI